MADEEFAQAVAFYESKQNGVGERFYQEVFRTLHWISANPATLRLRKNYRRINLAVFPYYIAYVTHADVVWVVAVAHAQRKPDYWLKRMKG